MINETFKMYGLIPSYRATLDRGGAANPADVAVVGDADAIAAGMQEFADIGVTDFVVAIPRSAPTAEATAELLGAMARSNSA